MEEISYSLDALHGLGDFNKPGRTAQVAAKLITRLYIEKRFPSLDMSILIYKPSQGHFPLWLLNYLEQNRTGRSPQDVSFGAFREKYSCPGRGSRHNIQKAAKGIRLKIFPAIDLNKKVCEMLESERGLDLIMPFQN